MYRKRKEKTYSPSGQLLNILDRGTRKMGWSRDFPGLPSTSISLLGIVHSKHSCATLKKTMDQRNSNNIFPKWLVVLGSHWTYFEAVTLSGSVEALFSETQTLSQLRAKHIVLGRLRVRDMKILIQDNCVQGISATGVNNSGNSNSLLLLLM